MTAKALLSTRFYTPALRPDLVSRPRLMARLNAGLSHGRRLTLVAAPAGFGKTTLIASWLAQSKINHSEISINNYQLAWLSIDEGLNDPLSFLSYLIAAIQQVDGQFGQTLQPLLQSPQAASQENLVTALINDLSASSDGLLLVLDDYHLLTSFAIHDMLSFLLDNQPANFHLVVGTREDPPLPLARLRARGQITEIRERSLRFTPGETAAFLGQAMKLDLSPEAIAALEVRTEGWAAGLQLAALAIQEEQDDVRAKAFIASFAGDDRYVMDYLVSEVIQRQPGEIRHFLSQTSILDQLTAALCEAVLGIGDVAERPLREQGSGVGDAERGRRGDAAQDKSPSPAHQAERSSAFTSTPIHPYTHTPIHPYTPTPPHAQAILEHLERANLFIIPLDHRREWYRYHPLFAEVLRASLAAEDEKTLHRRAARWYEANGYLSQAVHHLLACADTAEDLEAAELLISRSVEEMILEGDLSTVRGWLELLPDERIWANGLLATYKAWILAVTGDLVTAGDYIQAAETSFRQADASNLDLAKLSVLRSFIVVLLQGDYQQAIDLAAQALEEIDEDQAHWRIMALWAMAESQERTGDIDQAIATLRDAHRAGRALGGQPFTASVTITLAAALQNRGWRREAVAICEEAIAGYTDETGRVSPVAGLVFSRLGLLAYEANQLDLAGDYHRQGIALSEGFGLPGYLFFAYGLSAPTLYAQGETEAALEALQKAYHYASKTNLADPAYFLAWEADIRLRQGDLPFVRRWAETAGLSADDEPQYLRMDEHLVYGRLLLAQGQPSDARRWLARLEAFCRERGLVRWLITIHLLQALVAERTGDQATAADLLSQALQIAAPEDFYRAFLDEDRQLLSLLPEVRSVASTFVDQLLDYAGPAGSGLPAVGQSLVEPLSERELEVLRLIAAGLKNSEIAQELYITTGTVKRHTNHIYGKLSVHSRTEAVARARELGVL